MTIHTKKGFTIMEVLVAVVIAATLATLAIPRFTRTFERVRAAEGVNHLNALLAAQKAYFIENNAYSTNPALLDVIIDQATNFATPPVVADPGNPVANPIASIRRIGSYWLEINEEGTITCADAAPNTFTCADAGY